MHKCKFSNENHRCYFKKDECREVDFTLCKYYKKQHPIDREVYQKRFVKALQSALEKRNIFPENPIDYNILSIDYDLSIYENVKSVIDSLPKIVFKKKVKRKINKKDLEGDILKNITNNLYDVFSINLSKIDWKNNRVILKENNKDVVYQVLIEIRLFIDTLLKARNKQKIIEKHCKVIN